jgi:hypothetical protein
MDTKIRKVRRTQERHYSAHHMLLEVARRANDCVARKEPGWSYEAVTAIVFSALAVEALLNAFGDRKIENWGVDFESARPLAKARLVAQALSIGYHVNAEPWATLQWLFRVRNLAVHAKPAVIKTDVLLTDAEVERRLFDRPDSLLERELTAKNAQRAVDAVVRLRDELCASMPADELLGLSADGWSGHTAIVENQSSDVSGQDYSVRNI